MTWIGITFAVLSAGTSIIGQRQAADAQEKAQRRASEQERQRQLAEMSSMRTKQRFEQIALSQKLQINATKAREARATSKVVADARGIGGITEQLISNETSRQEAQYSYSALRNQQINNINTALSLENSQMQSRGNLLRINQPIEQPNYLGAVLDGASVGINMHNVSTKAGFEFKNPFKTT